MPTAVCPHCFARVKLPDAWGEPTFNCPRCKATVTLGKPTPEPAFDVVEEPEPAHDLDDDEPPRRKRKWRDEEEDDEEERQGKRRGLGCAATIATVAWAGLFLSVGGGGLLFCAMIKESKTDIAIAAIGALFSTVFIGLYILARCIEKLVAISERSRQK